MGRKIVVIISLLVIFAVSIFISTPTVSNASVSPPLVEVTPNVVNIAADYKITFTIHQALPYQGKITIIFPMGTGIPCSSCNPYIPASFLYVNGVNCTTNGIGNTTLRTVDIYSPVSLTAGSQVVVFISREARITTPTNEGSYTLQLYTSSEPDPVSSQPFVITKSRLSKPSVFLSNSLSGRVSSYTLSFLNGPVYSLIKNSDFIKVYFNIDTSLPPSIKGTYITVNNLPLQVEFVSVEDNIITIPIPTDISPNSLITIKFSIDAGIKNPSTPGPKTLFVSSSKDTEKVESEPYEIIDVSNYSTKIIVNPPMPNGNNGWYTISPIVSFIPRLPEDSSATVYYSLDQSDFVPFGLPFVIPDGKHVIKYYTLNSNNEKEEIKYFEIKVDTQPPIVNILEPENSIVTANSSFDIRVSVVDASSTSLYLNGEKIEFSGNEALVRVKLQEGLNEFNFIAVDEAGNQGITSLTIKRSSKVPKLTIVTPSYMSEVKNDVVNVSGTVDIPSEVWINEDKVNVNEDGSFLYTLSLENFSKGLVVLKVVAKSVESGLTSEKSVAFIYNPKPKQIILEVFVGSPIAYKNGEQMVLDTPPFIDPKTNRTLVPVRFISESLNAKVEWNSIDKTVSISLGNTSIKLQIGSDKALIDGRVLNLDQPPIILNGRTMVPLRFISEAFGAKVEWDSLNKKITIMYPSN